jgi:molecular chaperone GrpE
MGPNRQPFEKSDGVSVPEATRLASGADAGSDASVRPEGEDPGAPLTDAEPEPGSAEPAHELELEELELEELEARAERADEYLELAQRTKADFENYRKRAAREAAAAQDRGVGKLARELLPAIDNLDRALAASGVETPEEDGAAHTLTSGIKLVQSELAAALSRVGIEAFSPEGEPFDPQRHEAIAQQPVPGAEPGTIVEVYQRGYTLGEAVLRPARVVVAG